MKLLLAITMFVFTAVAVSAQTRNGTSARRTHQTHKTTKGKTLQKNKDVVNSKEANEKANKKASSTSTSGSGKKDN
jgi:hypothetical protein